MRVCQNRTVGSEGCSLLVLSFESVAFVFTGTFIYCGGSRGHRVLYRARTDGGSHFFTNDLNSQEDNSDTGI